MQLEKATSHASEAGLAGWISSNDVTLFTMVLVVIIALFLHANLLKGREDLASTTEELDQTIGQRDTLDARLRQRQQQLEQTQDELASEQEAALQLEQQRQRLESERQRLDRELAESLERIAALDQRIAGLASEKTALQTSKADLETAKSRLEGEKATLTQERISLNQRLADAAEQLEEKITILEGLQAERDRLKEKADQLDVIVATLQKKLDTSDAQLTAARSEADKQVRDLEQQVDAQAKRAADYLARLRRAAELFKGMQTEKATLTGRLDEAERRYQQQLDLNTTVNRELVGLNGKLQRVAILFDASGSMREQGTGDEDRWAEAQKIATTWLAHLDVDECVLIVFSSDVRTFPGDGSLAKVRGPVGESNRAALMQQLTAVQPAGWTNTLEALQKAYEYQVDTIVLFSDGAPTNPNSGRYDEQVARRIYTLCREHADVPINTIGLGNYFDPTLSTFLRTVARLTGGTFRGR